MSIKKIDDDLLSAIGVAIRDKLHVTTLYKPSQMPSAIRQIRSNPVIRSKTIILNGTYIAPNGVDGYSPITVNVPNSYAAGDEGKVVSSGALVAQTSVTKTANGTYATTTNNEVVVAIPVASGEDF